MNLKELPYHCLQEVPSTFSQVPNQFSQTENEKTIPSILSVLEENLRSFTSVLLKVALAKEFPQGAFFELARKPSKQGRENPRDTGKADKYRAIRNLWEFMLNPTIAFSEEHWFIQFQQKDVGILTE